MRCPPRVALLPVFGLLCAVPPLPAATTAAVDSKANIFAAGRAATAPMDGTVPPSYSFSPGAGKVLTFQSVTGTVQCGPTPPWSANGPDGLAYASDIASYNNISGITHPRKSMFLVGVFLADSLPAAAPARLDFTDDAFTTLSPAIGQTFFIGDGLTGTGAGTPQQFAVPSAATRLFLGFADANNFRGNPGYYFDNSGSLTATFSMTTGETCTYTLSPAGGQAPAAGGAGTVSVSTAGGCAWTALSNVGWITVTSGASGSGNGTVSYSVAANTGTASRTGTLAIAGQTFTVTQQGSGGVPGGISQNVSSSANIFAAGRATTAPMDGTVPPSYSFSPGAGKVLTFQSVTGTVQCGTNPPWSANGPDGLAYASDIASYNNISGIIHPRKSMFLVGVFLADSLPAAAPARLDFTDDAFTTLSPAIGQTFFIGDGLTGTGAGTPQQFAVPSAATRLFLGFADASYFRGNPGAYFDNSGSLAAAFSMTAGGGPVICTYTLSPAGSQAPAAGGAGTVSVGAAGGCAWTAISNAGWITVTSGASGSGGGTVSYSVAASTGTASRSGTLTIAGQTFTVTQSGASAVCEYTINPTSASAPAAGGGGTVSITVANNCSWVAASNSNWITVAAGSSGSGSGSVSYTVAANTASSARTGTLTVAGRTFTVTQAGTTPASRAPVISSGGIGNAADYIAVLAPGGMMAIFGTDLAPATRAASGVPLPTSLEGVSVEVVDGSRTVNAPLFFVSPTQINAQLPSETASAGVRVRVRTAAGQSNAELVSVAPRAPRLFTKTQNGQGEPILLHADYSFVGPESPAKPGEALILYLTGLGAVTPALPSGRGGGDGGSLGPLNVVAEPVSIEIGGQTVPAAFAGMAPGFVGVYQLNFVVPRDVAGGWQELEILCNEEVSQRDVAFLIRTLPPPLATVPVGREGKTVEAGGLRVAIPAGALTAPVNLQVTEIAPPEGLAQVGRAYTLEGLPLALGAPLEISLVWTSAEQGETYIIVDSFVEGGPHLGVRLLPARIEGNRLTATLPAGSLLEPLAMQPKLARTGLVSLASGGQATAESWVDRIGRFIVGMLMSRRSIPGGSFVVRYPRWYDVAMVDKRLEHLEAAKTTLEQQIGLRWGRNLPWNAEIVLFPSTESYRGPGEWDTHMASWHAAPSSPAWLVLNSAYTTNGPDLRFLDMAAGHELFRGYQNSYTAAGPYASQRWPWLEEAASTWFQHYYGQGGPETKYTPLDVPASSTRHFFGVFLGRELFYVVDFPDRESYPRTLRSAWERGYGAAMFLHYLVKKKGSPTIIRDIFESRERIEGTLATLNAVAGNLSSAWRGFCEEWMAGKIYSGEVFPKPAEIVQRALRPLFDLRFSGGYALTHVWSVSTLSALLYEVALPRDWQPSRKLSLRLDDPKGESEAIVYSYLPGSPPRWTHLKTFRGPVEIDDAGRLGSEGARIFILVVAGHWDVTTPSDLKLTVGQPTLLPELQKATEIGAGVQGRFVCKTTESQLVCPTEVGTLYPVHSTGEVWRWSGPRLEARETTYNSNRTVKYQTEITAEFSDTGEILRRAEVKETATSSTDLRRFNLVLTNLPYADRLESDRAVTYVFELKGPQAKSNLTVDWSYGRPGEPPPPPRITSTEIDASDPANPLRLWIGVTRPK